jgi:hypothetical protein
VTYRTLQQGIDWLAEKGYVLPKALCESIPDGDELSCDGEDGDHVCPVASIQASIGCAGTTLAWAIDALMKAEERIERVRNCSNCSPASWTDVDCEACVDWSEWTEAN